MINSFHFTGENLIKNNTVQLEVTFLLENDYYDRIFKCNLVCKKVHKKFIFKKIKNLKNEIINDDNKMINFKINWNKDDILTKNEIKKISNFFKNFIIVEKILEEQTWNLQIENHGVKAVDKSEIFITETIKKFEVTFEKKEISKYKFQMELFYDISNKKNYYPGKINIDLNSINPNDLEKEQEEIKLDIARLEVLQKKFYAKLGYNSQLARLFIKK